MPRKKEPTFEEALARLQDIVEKMEQGDLPLKEFQEAGGAKTGMVTAQGNNGGGFADFAFHERT